ncbi:MAG: putative DCC family thiol-disulfide oxidoreductase YuxK, partial [Planctomycetota bacterium]
TGGQYSLFRAIFGTYLAIHFLHLIPYGAEVFSNAGVFSDGHASPLFGFFPNLFLISDSPAMVSCALVAGVLASVLLAVGKLDRLAAVFLWLLWASLLGRNPLILNPGIPFVGWLLLAHALLPTAPFGSLSAVGRTDPKGNWSMPPAILTAAWLVLALGYSYSGYTKLISPSWLDGSAFGYLLANPLARDIPLRGIVLSLPEQLLQVATWSVLAMELLYAPLALFRRARKWIWLIMVSMHLGLVVLVDFADLTIGMLMMHLFVFDPAWIPAKLRGQRSSGQGTTEGENETPDVLFYDGSCGLCHRTTRLLLAEDAGGEKFRFAPLDSATYREAFADHEPLPDSLVLLRPDGQHFTRTSAVVLLLERLGGWWRLIALGLFIIPRPLRDAGYDGVARIRHRLFARPTDACPLMPPEYGRRWLP